MNIKINPDISAIDNILHLLNTLIKINYPDYKGTSLEEISIGNPTKENYPTHNTVLLISPSEHENKISRPIQLEYTRLSLISIIKHKNIASIVIPAKEDEYTDDEIIDYIVSTIKIVKDQCDYTVNQDKSSINITAKDNNYLYIDSVDIPITIV